MRKLLLVASAAAALHAGCARADAQSATYALPSNSQPQPFVLPIADSFNLPTGDFTLTLDVNFLKGGATTTFSESAFLDHYDPGTNTYYVNDLLVVTNTFGVSAPSYGLDLFPGTGLSQLLTVAPTFQSESSETGPVLSSCTTGAELSHAGAGTCLASRTTETIDRGWWGDVSHTIVLSDAQGSAINATGDLPTLITHSDSRAVTASLMISTPEPASWALMIIGFGGVGVALRRRVRYGLV